MAGTGAELGRRLRDGDLAAAPAVLNLVESRTAGDEVAALLREVSPAALGAEPAGHLIGLTGPPGAGKSSLLSALVHAWRADGRPVAVLAVDPSSKRSGGSLLGDRARIEVDPADRGVLIRSTAAGGPARGPGARDARRRPRARRRLRRRGHRDRRRRAVRDRGRRGRRHGRRRRAARLGDALQFIKAGSWRCPTCSS
jgi:hypothetical protein